MPTPKNFNNSSNDYINPEASPQNTIWNNQPNEVINIVEYQS